MPLVEFKPPFYLPIFYHTLSNLQSEEQSKTRTGYNIWWSGKQYTPYLVSFLQADGAVRLESQSNHSQDPLSGRCFQFTGRASWVRQGWDHISILPSVNPGAQCQVRNIGWALGSKSPGSTTGIASLFTSYHILMLVPNCCASPRLVASLTHAVSG